MKQPHKPMRFFDDQPSGSETQQPAHYDARLNHIANTFKLYRENKLKFYYPENQNTNYNEEEDEILMRARFNAACIHRVKPDENQVSAEHLTTQYTIKISEDKKFTLKAIDQHNSYAEEKLPDFEMPKDKKMWATTIFFAIAESVSKLLKK